MCNNVTSVEKPASIDAVVEKLVSKTAPCTPASTVNDRPVVSELVEVTDFELVYWNPTVLEVVCGVLDLF